MLKRLYLHQFRNYTKAEFTFADGVNWIVGKNGQGKTNLLEAIYLLSTGRSYRTHQLSQLIQEGAPFFFLEAEVEKDGVLQTLKLSFDGKNKTFQHNATNYTQFTPLIGLIPHVLCAPEDLTLVQGAPSFRRKFLNVHLSHLDPLYLRHLVRYHRAMRQRNELLRKKTEVAIEPWEEAMAHSGDYLMKKRDEIIRDLQEPIRKTTSQLSSGSDLVEMSYLSSLPVSSPDQLKEHWRSQRKKELYVGSTLQGPHRDDVSFVLKGLSVRSFASEGQKHSVSAALRLCLWHHLHEVGHDLPIMSVDDFGAHLDRMRQSRFEKALSGLGQIFLTSPEVNPEIFPGSHVFEISDGSEVLKVSSP